MADRGRHRAAERIRRLGGARRRRAGRLHQPLRAAGARNRGRERPCPHGGPPQSALRGGSPCGLRARHRGVELRPRPAAVRTHLRHGLSARAVGHLDPLPGDADRRRRACAGPSRAGADPRGLSARPRPHGRRRRDRRHLGHREAGRQRCRRHGNRRAAGGGRLPPARAQVVRQQRRRRARAHPRPARGCCRRRPGPRPLSGACPGPRRYAQPLPHQAAEGEARHPGPGDRGDRAGGRARAGGGATTGRPPHDDGGTRLQPHPQRHGLGRDPAPRLRGSAGPCRDAQRLRPAPRRLPDGAGPADRDAGAPGGERGAGLRRGPGVRRGRADAGGAALDAPRHRARQVPHGGVGDRRHQPGDRDPRRQRLYRGISDRQALPRCPGAHRVGRTAQHPGARSAAPGRRRIAGARGIRRTARCGR